MQLAPSALALVLRGAAVLGLAAVAAVASAQERANERANARAPAQDRAPYRAQDPAEGRLRLTTHDAATSRSLFRACDRDADDRLDLLEACRCLETLGTARDRTGFRRLDADRSGYLDWEEFDAWYRSAIRAGETLYLRPWRAATALPLGEASPAQSPQRQLVELFDRDRDGALGPDERRRMIEQLKLPPTVAQRLAELDGNRDGTLDEGELVPMAGLLRVLPAKPSAPTAPTTTWLDADVDQNGTIDAEEFAAVLRRVDPQLQRWTRQLMDLADRNKDGKLLPAEMLPAPSEPTTGAVLPTAPRTRR